MPRETDEERREREAREKRSDEVDAKLRAHPNFTEDTDDEDGVTVIRLLGRDRKPEELPKRPEGTGERPPRDDEPEDDEVAEITFELNHDIICRDWPMPKSDED